MNIVKNQRPGSIPSVLDVTSQQLANVQMALNAVTPFLLMETKQREFVAGQKDPGDEVTDSAITTFIKACDVLDKILDDAQRWTSERYAGLEKALEVLYLKSAAAADAQRQLSQAQTEATAMVSRPCLLLKADITRRKDGTWVVKHGALKGEGKTAAEASLDFDAEFYGLMKETGTEID